MSIKINGRAVVIRGVKMYKIDEISALKEGELPLEYTQGNPCVFLYGGMLEKKIRIEGDGDILTLGVGYQYTVNEMELRLDIIRAAGERLREINARLAKENDGWEGTHYWTI
jgi:hypothetical protein